MYMWLEMAQLKTEIPFFSVVSLLDERIRSLILDDPLVIIKDFDFR